MTSAVDADDDFGHTTNVARMLHRSCLVFGDRLFLRNGVCALLRNDSGLHRLWTWDDQFRQFWTTLVFMTRFGVIQCLK